MAIQHNWEIIPKRSPNQITERNHLPASLPSKYTFDWWKADNIAISFLHCITSTFSQLTQPTKRCNKPQFYYSISTIINPIYECYPTTGHSPLDINGATVEAAIWCSGRRRLDLNVDDPFIEFAKLPMMMWWPLSHGLREYLCRDSLY